MKINFRAVRIGKMKRGQSMLKDMAMTVIATTISIVLTFGSSSIIEKSQREKNRRQTVMMVIHDIEENARTFRELLDDEKAKIELIHYLTNNIDNIDDIPWDTITTVYDYLLEGNSFMLDDSKEKLFQENQVLWSSLDDNTRIIDIIHAFFFERRSNLNDINSNFEWKKPISKQDNIHYGGKGVEYGYPLEMRKILSKILKEPKVQHFMHYSYLRQKKYGEFSYWFNRYAEKLKFLLGISNDELRSFVEDYEQLGRTATKNDIIGEWMMADTTSSSVMYHYRVHYRPDGTVSVLSRNSFYPSEFQTANNSGYLLFTHKDVGRWILEKDTLFTTYFADSISCTCDLYDLPLSKHGNDSLRSIYLSFSNRFWREYEYKNKKEVTYKEYVRVDDDGSRMEITRDSGLSLYYEKSDNVNN